MFVHKLKAPMIISALLLGLALLASGACMFFYVRSEPTPAQPVSRSSTMPVAQPG